MGCVPSEVVSTPTAVSTTIATHQQMSIPTVATEYETIIISDERPFVTPIVAPDGSEVIYRENDAVLSWRGEGQIEKRSFWVPLSECGF